MFEQICGLCYMVSKFDQIIQRPVLNPSPLFRETRKDVLAELIRSRPFATLVTHGTGRLAADHLPMILHETDSGALILRGHVARANLLAADSTPTGDALAIFQGPQSYVTPSWYPSKQEHGQVVPTWNYVIAHAEGTWRRVTDTDWLMEHLHSLTDRMEHNREMPWSVSDAPSDFVARQLKGLVGIEIAVQSLTGIWKVSQNRPDADRSGVETGLLRDTGEEARQMAALVRDR